MKAVRSLGIVLSFGVVKCLFAGIDIAPIDASADRNITGLDVGLRRTGTLRPRGSREIASSHFMIDCGTIDRDFVDFEEIKDYLEPLGLKKARIQAGWAKCERVKGRYDFAWLDRIVDWLRKNGIGVYLELSYGNPLYEGAGGPSLGGGLPSSKEGLAAWDRWVEAVARHFAGRVDEWEIWNEPDKHDPQKVVALHIRSARILKSVDRFAHLNAFAFADSWADEKSVARAKSFLSLLGADSGLFETLSIHAYMPNPDWAYPNLFPSRQRILDELGIEMKIRQGESGAPSDWLQELNLRGRAWTEVSQAKWDMRRMIGDVGNGYESDVFHICDMVYNDDRFHRINKKGLLRANGDKRVIQVKKAYYAVQNVASVFDDEVVPVQNPVFRTDDLSISAYQFMRRGSLPMFCFWSHGPMERRPDGTFAIRRDMMPSDSFSTRLITFDWQGEKLSAPVWVDLFSGAVYEFPEKWQIVHSTGVTLVNVPVYDSPCLIAPRDAIFIDSYMHDRFIPDCKRRSVASPEVDGSHLISSRQD